MKQIRQDAEQLNESVQQLGKNTSTGARLALFLLDNLAELLMYRKALFVFGWDDEFRRPEGYDLSRSKRRKVSRNFDEKIGLLIAKEGILSAEEEGTLFAEEAEVLSLGHRIRSEAYHRGKARDSILPDVAVTYLDIVCAIWPRLWNGDYSYSKMDEVTNFLADFGLSGGTIDKGILAEVANRICASIEVRPQPLQIVLGGDLCARIDEIFELINHLSTGWTESPPPDVVLKRIQFFDYISNQPTTNIETNEQCRDDHKNLDRRLDAYIPTIDVVKLEEWNTIASAWGGDTERLDALILYNKIDKNLIAVEEPLFEAVYKNDQWGRMP